MPNTRKKIRKTKQEIADTIMNNPNYPMMRFYTIQELTVFGINEVVLTEWYKSGHLVPFIKCGNLAKFRYEDLLNACKHANQSGNLNIYNATNKTKLRPDGFVSEILKKKAV